MTARLRPEQRRLEGEVEALDRRLGALVTLGRVIHRAQRDTLSAALERNLDAVRAAAAGDRCLEQEPWTDPGWGAWKPATGLGERGPTAIRVGEQRELRSGHLLGLPVEVDLSGTGLRIVIRSRNGHHRAGNGLLQSLLVRSAAVLPGRTSYGLVDPVGGGRAFPQAGSLPTLAAVTGDGRRDLEAVMAEVDRRTGPGADRAGVLVAIADFPVGYDRRIVEWVRSLCRAGPTAGVHLLLHHHRAEEGDDGDLGEMAVIDVPTPVHRSDGTTAPAGAKVDVVVDDPPPAAVARRVLEQVRIVDDAVVGWEELGHPPEEA